MYRLALLGFFTHGNDRFFTRILQRVKSLPFWGEPSCIGHEKKYPRGAPIGLFFCQVDNFRLDLYEYSNQSHNLYLHQVSFCTEWGPFL